MLIAGAILVVVGGLFSLASLAGRRLFVGDEPSDPVEGIMHDFRRQRVRLNALLGLGALSVGLLLLAAHVVSRVL